jgi:hypothetical protein
MHRYLGYSFAAFMVLVALSWGPPASAEPPDNDQLFPSQKCDKPPGISHAHLDSEDLIAIATTYLESLLVEGAPGIRLHPDVQRWFDNYNLDPPSNDGIEDLLPSVEEENLGDDFNATFEDRRWTVDLERQEAFLIYDIYSTITVRPIIVVERFLIEDCLIREIEAKVIFPEE